MMHGLVVAILAVGALVVVLGPLRRAETDEHIDPATEIEERKYAALTAILDLESERDVGKLSEIDFNELRSTYELEAIDALHELDGLERTGGRDPLEDEILAVRERLARTDRCPSCGAPRAADVSPCPSCGA